MEVKFPNIEWQKAGSVERAENKRIKRRQSRVTASISHRGARGSVTNLRNNWKQRSLSSKFDLTCMYTDNMCIYPADWLAGRSVCQEILKRKIGKRKLRQRFHWANSQEFPAMSFRVVVVLLSLVVCVCCSDNSTEDVLQEEARAGNSTRKRKTKIKMWGELF